MFNIIVQTTDDKGLQKKLAFQVKVKPYKLAIESVRVDNYIHNSFNDVCFPCFEFTRLNFFGNCTRFCAITATNPTESSTIIQKLYKSKFKARNSSEPVGRL